jgi:transcriptional regulator of arginine metabolism
MGAPVRKRSQGQAPTTGAGTGAKRARGASPSATALRRAALLGILETEVVTDQDDLRRRLARAGHRVTQPSVSRDLNALGVVKVGGRYRAPTALPAVSSVVAGAMLRVCVAGPHLLVLKTLPGRASVVALEIDAAQWPEVVGTVAGDDTVFVALGGREDQKRVAARLAPRPSSQGAARPSVPREA